MKLLYDQNDPHSYEHKLIQEYRKIQPVTLCYTVVVQVAFYIMNTVIVTVLNSAQITSATDDYHHDYSALNCTGKPILDESQSDECNISF